MYPITNEVKALFEAEQRKVLRITGTDKNGAVISITGDNVIEDSFQVDRYSCNGEKLEVGTAIAAQMTLTLENSGGQYNGIVFEGAELFVEVGIADWTQSSPTITYVPCGYFTPDNQPRRLSTISITALDRMTLFDVVVDAVDLTFPTTVAGLVGQVCTLCGVTLAQSISGLVNAGVNVTEMPEAQEEITYRNLIQWCAGVMGTNAWFDWSGQLQFSWYANATGYVSTADNRYSSDLYEDDLTVSGVEYTNDSGIVIVEGTDDYAIDLTGNAIVGPLVATVLPPLNTALNGFTYRPFTAATVNAPYLWPMDIVTFTDKDGNNHTSALTNVAFGLNGTTAMESKGMTYAINKLAQPNGFTREQAQLVNQAMEHVEQDIDDSLTQQEIFNRLTDNGAAQGLVLYNGQLYINASYINAGYLSADHIQGGTLTLGGQGNQNGVLQVLDASGNVITVLNNAGADITNGSLTTYSTDRQTRTILSDGLLRFQFYNSAVQPIGWRDALRLAADPQSATIGTFAGIAELDISGRGRVKIKNKDSITDPDYAEIDMDDDSVLLTATRNDSGLLEWASLQVTKDGVTVSKKGSIGDPYVLFELAAGQSSKPLSVGNGGTGATTPAAARAKLGITPANIGAVSTSDVINVAHGGTNATTPAQARANLEITPANIGAVAKTGDTMTGTLKWASGTALPAASSLQYFLGIDAFADGGTTHYITAANLLAAIGAVSTSAVIDVPHGGTGKTTNWEGLAALSTPRGNTIWKDAPVGISVFKYEGDTSSFDVPGTSFVVVIKESNARGVAYAIRWAGPSTALWISRLHDDSGQNNWSSWKTIVDINGAVPVTSGGTGATDAPGARANLGITPANIGAVAKSGDTMTGPLLILDDIVQTTGYISGEAGTTDHALKLGHFGNNVMQFFEYGGQFDFYQSQSGTNTLLFQVKNGVSSKPLPVNNGGTGATTPDGACANIGAVKKSGDTMTGPLTVPNMVVRSGSWQFYFMQDSNGAEVGHVRGDEAAHHIAFREITPGTNLAYEDYYLPNPTNQNGGIGYSILTTKYAVNVTQGGTGATDAPGARANLGIATTVTTFQTNGITANGNFNTGLRPSQHVIDAIYCTAGHIAITPYCNDNDYWFAHCIHPTTGAVITTNFQVTIRYHNIY